MTTNWAKNLSCFLYLPSALLSQLLWFNSNIDSKGTFISGFASHSINFVGQIFDDNGKTVARSWVDVKSEYNLESKLKYRYIQLTDAFPKL